MGYISEQLISNEEAKEIFKARNNPFVEYKFPLTERENYLSKGYEEFKKPTKQWCYLRKKKETTKVSS